MNSFSTILIVDDDPDDLSFFIDAIYAINPAIQCTIAVNGKDGIEKLNNFLPDLIISDINMPVMDGKAFLQTIRTYMQLTTPVVMVSTSPAEKYRVLSLGANYFFAKCSTISELHQQLKKVLQMDFSVS